ncbi:hypothetical protein IDH26_05680 [Pelagibacterales bacterium SAG-MED50]|nr:hypothetical protein [Pelagibacterales bacterium SAG-MED50]
MIDFGNQNDYLRHSAIIHAHIHTYKSIKYILKRYGLKSVESGGLE